MALMRVELSETRGRSSRGKSWQRGAGVGGGCGHGSFRHRAQAGGEARGWRGGSGLGLLSQPGGPVRRQLMRGVRDPGLSIQRNPGVRTTNSGVVIKREGSTGEQSCQTLGAHLPGHGAPGSGGRAAEVKSITHPDNVELDTLESGLNPLGTRSVKPDKETAEHKRVPNGVQTLRRPETRLSMAAGLALSPRLVLPPRPRPPRRAPPPQIHGPAPGVACNERHPAASPLLSGLSQCRHLEMTPCVAHETAPSTPEQCPLEISHNSLAILLSGHRQPVSRFQLRKQQLL